MADAEFVRYRAVVQKVCRDGEHGPYAVATLDPCVRGLEGSVTFSLKPPIWNEMTDPEQGAVVTLKHLTQKRAGWRAGAVWYRTTDDVLQANQQSERSTAMEETKQTIDEMIEMFASKEQEEPTNVCLAWESQPEVQRVNKAFRNMPDEQRIHILFCMLDMWHKSDCRVAESTRATSIAELHKILGDKHDEELGRGLIFTLTGNGRQLRCWYGKPGAVGLKHCDSCGAGLLFGVYGESENVRKYIDALLNERWKEYVIKLPNGGAIYGFSWNFY